MVNEKVKKSPVNGEKREELFSPRFKSMAAMAGWDEEELLIASFGVEETPDRQHKQRKLTGLQHFVTPPTNSRRSVWRYVLNRVPLLVDTGIGIHINSDSYNNTQKKFPIICSDLFVYNSFCRKCLQSAADICGTRCPKCRQLIRNGRSCTVNTVLWNTIQLLFPKEVESRQEAGDLNRERSLRTSVELPPSQDEDAAWALQLQREEYSRGDI
ncbi:hypothetical protein R3W88_005074 [Solanum pinnatisectum]|uniref:RING-type E3 ubiquitin transferase n=1 Tax=Solanum pinnatisectum TaxID=50273 RepID=A0AAV9KB16_9SOLN|nr:hypothetical protein R3W88_005074 [Solanum pinnatisectum]